MKDKEVVLLTYSPMAQASMRGVIRKLLKLKSKMAAFSCCMISMSIKYCVSLCCTAIKSCFYVPQIYRSRIRSEVKSQCNEALKPRAEMQ